MVVIDKIYYEIPNLENPSKARRQSGKVERPGPSACGPEDGRQGSGELHAAPEQVPLVIVALGASKSFEAGG